MEGLPDDVIVEIFSFLPHQLLLLEVRTVCRHWYTLSHSADLWQTVDLTLGFNQTEKQAMVSNLKRVQDHVKILKVDPRLLQTIFKNDIWQFLTLKTLHLNTLCKTTVSVLGEPNLRYPRLEKVYFSSAFDNKLVLSAFSGLKLDTFEWKYSGPFQQFRETILALGKMDNLQKVRLHVKSLDNELLSYLLKNCHTLHSLKLYFFNVNIKIDNDAFLSLTDNCSLTELGLPTTSITDESLYHISKTCPFLKLININNCFYITDVGIRHLATNCIHLENVHIGNIPNLTSCTVQLISNKFKHLKVLNLKQCMGMENRGIANIFKKCSMLIKLNVSFCPKVNSHVLLPDKIWTSNVPLKLREISLSGNNNITSEVVFRIIKLCCCLQSFELASCPSIQSIDTASNKQGISNTRSECVQKPQKTDHSHMKSVNFIGSLNVEDSVIIALSYICPDLRNLRLTDCKKLTKNVLGVVFRNCRFIDSLEIANCTFKRKEYKDTVTL